MPKRVVEWLRQEDYVINTLADVKLRGATDNKIADFAVRNHMAVLTQDEDFAKLQHTLYKRKLAVILVNTKEGTAQSVIKALNTAQSKIDLKNIQNKLVIITQRRIRIVS